MGSGNRTLTAEKRGFPRWPLPSGTISATTSPAKVSKRMRFGAIRFSKANRAAHRAPLPLNSASLPSALNSRHLKSARRERSMRISPSPPTDRRCALSFAANRLAQAALMAPRRLSTRIKSFPLPESFMKGIGRSRADNPDGRRLAVPLRATATPHVPTHEGTGKRVKGRSERLPTAEPFDRVPFSLLKKFGDRFATHEILMGLSGTNDVDLPALDQHFRGSGT